MSDQRDEPIAELLGDLGRHRSLVGAAAGLLVLVAILRRRRRRGR